MPFLASLPGLLSLGGAAIGGLAGALGKNEQQDYSLGLQPMSGLGNAGSQGAFRAFQNIQDQAGDAQKYTGGAQTGLAQMLQQYAQSGGLPNQGQINSANQYAQNIFQPQQAALNNTFNQAQINTNRQAAALGRPVNDPVLQGKLAQYMGQQQNLLSGQQTALGSQVAMQLPQQQLGFQQQLANQAMQNQSSILSLGQGLLQNAQNYQLGTATRNQSASGGGGLAGGLLGALSGFGGGMTAGSLFGNQGIGSPGGFGPLDFSGQSGMPSSQIGNYQLPNFPTFGGSGIGGGIRNQNLF